MVDSALLQLIAQPKIASPYASFRAGQRAVAAEERAQQELAIKQAQESRLGQSLVLGNKNFDLNNRKLLQDEQEFKAAQDAEKIELAKTKYYDLAGALGVSNDPLVQNRIIESMLEVANTNGFTDGVVMAQGLAQATPEQRMAALPEIIKVGQRSGAIGQLKGSEGGGSTTDIERFVQRAREQYILDNGEEPPPKLLNNAALTIKRAQEKEVSANQWAKRNVDLATEERLKFNAGMGTALAEIGTAAQILEAKGEITPVQKKTNAKKALTKKLSALAQNYFSLDDIGAITNVEKSTVDNILSSLSASTVGQAYGKLVGSKPQSIRNKINATIPLVLNDVRQASDMGARGLDSEKELEFYSRAATDPKTDLQSNLAALIVLDKTYGEGLVAKQLESSVDPTLVESIAAQGASILNQRNKTKVNLENITPEQLNSMSLEELQQLRRQVQ